MTLLTEADYRSISGDTTSLSADVTAALATGQQLLEEWLRRPLELLERTEQVRIHADGRAYPSATPIQAVSVPSWAVVMDGTTVLSLFADQNPLWDILVEPYRYGPGGAGGQFDTTMRPSTITYTGGFTSATLPRKLRQAIADLAQVELTTFSPVTAGVKQATVGDTSVTYMAPPDRAGVIDAILMTVRGFRHDEIGH